MRDELFNKRFTDITVALLILLFTYTAISKLSERDLFESVMLKSPLLTADARWLSWAIPITEIIAVLLLFFPSTKIRGLWLSLILMGLFTAYITYMLIYTPQLPCTCGGVLKKLTWVQHLEFNVLFTLLPAISLWLIKRQNDLLQ